MVTNQKASLGTRVTSFDVSRGIAISLMVLGHSATAVSNTSLGESVAWEIFNAAFSVIRMPLFFFLAGVFLVATLRKRGFKSWAIDKAQFLLYPWLVWSLLRGLLEVALYQLGIGGRLDLVDVLIGIVWDPRVWYLPALFVAFVVIAAVHVAMRGNRWWPLVAAAVIVLLIPVTGLLWWPPLLAVHPYSLFMLAGCVAGPAAVLLARSSRPRAAVLAVLSAGLFGVAAWVAAPAGALEEKLSPVFIGCSVVGVAMLLATGRLFDGTPVGSVLERLGKWSLIIYVTHAIPLSFARIALIRLGVDDHNILVLFPAVFGIAGPALLGWAHDRGHLRWLITMPGYRARAATRLP